MYVVSKRGVILHSFIMSLLHPSHSYLLHFVYSTGQLFVRHLSLLASSQRDYIQGNQLSRARECGNSSGRRRTRYHKHLWRGCWA
jgi:hypothetical protein